MKKISILNFDLSGNSMGRAYILGQMLIDAYDVEIIGPARKGYIWEPLKNSRVKILRVPYGKFPCLLFKLPGILKMIDGEIVYAVKPRFTSFGFGLLKKFISGSPLILDIDDWEVGFYMNKGFGSRVLKFFNLLNPNGFSWTWVMQFFIRYADRITTVSAFLQKKYGGEIIPHAKDTTYLDPYCFEHDALRMQLGLTEKRVVMFLGTPRAHKGVEDALNAVCMLNDPHIIMIIVGANPAGDYEKSLKKMGGDRLVMLDKISYGDVPRYLMLADVVVIPQRQTSDTVGQIPSKLFDAMAMAKPIIATAVSDIPEILENCGIIVPPHDNKALQRAITWVFENPATAKAMGMKARIKCLELYSVQIIGEKLKRIVGEVM